MAGALESSLCTDTAFERSKDHETILQELRRRKETDSERQNIGDGADLKREALHIGIRNGQWHHVVFDQLLQS